MASINDPLKTPFVGVFSRSGKMLANNFGKGDITVVSLRYKFDDEDDDICTIKMQMSDPKALDILSIERGTELRVIFGYLNNALSPEATVVVRDMTSKYGPNIIYTDLECTDYLTYLKIFRSPDVDGELSIIDYLIDQVYGKYKIVIKNRGKNIYTQRTLKKQPESVEVKYIEDWELKGSTVREPFDPLLRTGDLEPGKYSTPEGTRAILVKESQRPADAGIWHVNEEDPVRIYMETPITIPTSNRSIFIVLQDIFKKCPNGPWYVTGRGDTVEIHNRNLGGKIITSYKYKDEPGQLLDFQAKTKFENFERQSISYAGMDAKDRKNFFIDDYRKALLNQRTPKEILEDRKITDEEKQKQLVEFAELYEGGYATYRTDALEGAFIEPGTPAQRFLPGHFSEPVISRFDQPVNVRDRTYVDFSKYAPGLKQPEELKRIDEIEDKILRAVWYTIPLLSYDEAVNVTNNRERELAMEKEEGKIIVEGNPYLMDQQKISISNVHKQHEGSYYIKKCEHNITSQGFKTTLDCLKVSPEATIDTIGTITQQKYENGELTEDQLIYYHREKSVYGNDVLVTGRGSVGDRLRKTGGPAAPADVYEKFELQKLRFSDLYNSDLNYTKDSWAHDMVKVYNLSDGKVTNIALDPENK